MLECAANLACVGAEPLGTTNNLNFGNPEKPHVAWQLTESVRGLGEACRALEAPIVGGNVSLYNEGATGPIYPTPVIGMVGRLPDARPRGASRLRPRGRRDRARRPLRALAGRERARQAARRGAPRRSCPRSTSRPCAIAQFGRPRAPCASGALSSAHDIAEGGLAVALAECCLAGGLGAEVGRAECGTLGLSAGTGADPASARAALFGEGPGGFLVSGTRRRAARARARARDVRVHRRGRRRGAA